MDQSERPRRPVRSSTGEARRRVDWTIAAAPEDLKYHHLTWRAWFREVQQSTTRGLLLSLLLHGVLLLIAAWWLFDVHQRVDDQPLLMSWLTPAQTAPATQPVRIKRPIVLDLPAAQNTQNSTPRANTESNQPAPAPAVKPVEVANVLASRVALLEEASGADGSAAGDPKLRQSVKQALGWLARQQQADGRWELHRGYPQPALASLKTDTGATALALLCFLGAGEHPGRGEHQAAVEQGLTWLIDQQDSSGDLHDQRQEQGRQTAFYSHALATIAMCEALALSGQESYRAPAERAIDFLLRSQHPDVGGWKYRPLSQGMRGDLSVTGWALMALQTARIAGLTVPEEDFQRAAEFLDTVSEQGGSRYKYEPRDPPTRVTAALTAEGLLCRQWLGWPATHPPLVDGIAFLQTTAEGPRWQAGRRNVYEWYYVAQVLHHHDQAAFQAWFQPVAREIIEQQTTSGSSRSGQDVRGSWHPSQPPPSPEEYGDKAGRLYVTALCVLILETPLRHRSLSARNP
jgi:hypothetical protein